MFRNKKGLNIVWIVVDTLRADRLGCYGYFRDTCPNIDRLATEGVLFEDFYTSAISTGAAFSCLFTGMPAVKHRFYCTPVGRPNIMNFDDTIPTLPEIIQSNSDYSTLAVDNLINFAGHMKQTVRGFEYYINVTRDGGFPQPEYTAAELNDRFLPWLRSHRAEKFFAFLHLWDTHHNPYRAPGYRQKFKHPIGRLEGLPVAQAPAGYGYVPTWGRLGEIVWGISGQKLVRDMDGGAAKMDTEAEAEFLDDDQAISQDLYDCSIAYLDNQIQRVIDTLAEQHILDETIIVLTADHGEGLGIHGTWGHGLLYEDTIHIPLILWRPGLLPKGLRVKGFAQHVDIAPTLLELMGIGSNSGPLCSRIGIPSSVPGTGEVEVRMEGRSLLPHINGQQTGPDIIVAEVRRDPFDPGYRTLKTGQWKFIEDLSGQRQLYNLNDDPLEKINLADQDSARAEAMGQSLKDWLQKRLPDDGQDPMRIW